MITCDPSIKHYSNVHNKSAKSSKQQRNYQIYEEKANMVRDEIRYQS
jgi:hypothetical protein